MKGNIRHTVAFGALATLTAILVLVDMAVGSVNIPLSEVWAALTGGECPESVAKVVREIRLTKLLVAVIAGAALPVSGLQMQTLFRNPLAGPYVLGISSGASLGVALFILAAPLVGMTGGWMMWLGTAGAAWIGSAAVMVVVLGAARRIKDIMVILILGMMIGSGISAVVQILQYAAEEESLKSFVVWTMGSLGNVTGSQLPLLVVPVLVGLLLSVFTVKPLNLLLLGEEYASTMGLNMRRTRMLLFVVTILLAGSVTAFCGPIGFIGLAMPHVARMIFATADHRVLLPGSLLSGVAVMLLCDILSKSVALPINALTALVGIPVVIWIVLKNKSITL